MCEVRGSGRERSQWWLPGVEKDGYSKGARGDKSTPLGCRIVTPGVPNRHPRGDESSPVPVLNPGLPVESKPTIKPPPISPAGGGEKPHEYALERHSEDLTDWLSENVPSLDAAGQARLIKRCLKARPGCTAADIVRVCTYKLATAEGARNKGGLLIATVPAILAGEARVLGG